MTGSPVQAQIVGDDQLLNATVAGFLASVYWACQEDQFPCADGWPDLRSEHQLIFNTGREDSVRFSQLVYGRDWAEPVYRGDGWQVLGRWEFDASTWYSGETDVLNNRGYLAGVSMFYRYQLLGAYRPFVEVGVGPHVMDDVVVEDEQRSTNFQFMDTLGIGVEWDAFDLGYRYIHISNGSIKLPNPGLDYHMIYTNWRF